MYQPVGAQAYQAVFGRDTTGQKVLEDLTVLFYDIASYTKEDPYHTAFLEGQRSVVRFVLQKLAQLPDEAQQE